MLPIEQFRPAVKQGFFERVASKFHDRGWGEYISLCRYPELLNTMNLENPLFVVHPGYRGYYPQELEDRGIPPDSYRMYLDRLRGTVGKAVADGREVFVFTPTSYREKTLATIGHSDGVILIPTVGTGVFPDGEILGSETHSLYWRLQQTVRQADICGEYGDRGCDSIARCVVGVEQTFPDIHFTWIDECIYITGDRFRKLPFHSALST